MIHTKEGQKSAEKSEQSRVHRTIKIDTSLNTDATEM